MRAPLVTRFWAKVKKTDGCWLWTGAKTDGYGHIGFGSQWRSLVIILLEVRRLGMALLAFGCVALLILLLMGCGRAIEGAMP